MNKTAVLTALVAELTSQFRRVADAAGEARGYAADPDSKAENKYDTRTTEASYLAAGQAAKAEELGATLQMFTTWSPPDFGAGDAIDLGALVETAMPGARAAFLLAPAGGGMEVESAEGIAVTVISPQAPLFQRLRGARVGEAVAGTEMTIVAIG